MHWKMMSVELRSEHWCLNIDKCDERRRTSFEQFGYTDNCPECANARARREQAVYHSEQCRSRMEAILDFGDKH